MPLKKKTPEHGEKNTFSQVSTYFFQMAVVCFVKELFVTQEKSSL